MNKLEYALRIIENCDMCNGTGNLSWSNGDDYDFEVCECNPYELIIDEDGSVIWDNGLLSQDELAIFAGSEAN